MQEHFRHDITEIRNLFIGLPSGQQIPLYAVANIDYKLGPAQISRENAQRRVVIGVNARNRDLEGLIEEIQSEINSNLIMPAGYHIEYGGQFENLVEILLSDYYDPMYDYQFASKAEHTLFEGNHQEILQWLAQQAQ